MKNAIKKTISYLTFLCFTLPLWAGSPWAFKKEGEKTSLYHNDQLVTTFHPAAKNKPALHPLIASDGQDLSRAFPFSKREGEKQDHPHHTGLWFTHGDVNGYDLWHLDRGKPGKMVQQSFTTDTQSNYAKVKSSYQWQSLDGQVLLNDKRNIKIKREGKDTIIDFTIELTAPKGDVVLGDTKEGTFALRLHPMMDAKAKTDTGRMLNSEGGSGKDIWGKAAKWVAYSGDNAKGNTYTVAVFDHPQNLRYPTTWHARNYGLLSANPFGLSYYKGKEHDGSYKIASGQTLRQQYRIILQCQAADADQLHQQHKAFAKGK